MKIGYSVEGSTDRAVLEGLRQRWCPQAQLVEGHFRGMTDLSRRREIPKICVELQAKGVDCVIFLTDSNGPEWRPILNAERNRCPPRHEFTVEDPKGVVEAAFGITRDDKRETEIAEYVRNAPLRRWLTNPSFEHFYNSVRQKSLQIGCELENLRKTEF